MISLSTPKASTARTQTIAPIVYAPKTYTFIVTFRDRKSGDERSTEVTTLTDSFLPVLREVQGVRAELGLLGYDIYEVLDLNDPF
jgi:hypothetical protein